MWCIYLSISLRPHLLHPARSLAIVWLPVMHARCAAPHPALFAVLAAPESASGLDRCNLSLSLSSLPVYVGLDSCLLNCYVCLLGCVGVPWTLNTRTPFSLSGHVGCQGWCQGCHISIYLSTSSSLPSWGRWPPVLFGIWGELQQFCLA